MKLMRVKFSTLSGLQIVNIFSPNKLEVWPPAKVFTRVNILLQKLIQDVSLGSVQVEEVFHFDSCALDFSVSNNESIELGVRGSSYTNTWLAFSFVATLSQRACKSNVPNLNSHSPTSKVWRQNQWDLNLFRKEFVQRLDSVHGHVQIHGFLHLDGPHDFKVGQGDELDCLSVVAKLVVLQSDCHIQLLSHFVSSASLHFLYEK